MNLRPPRADLVLTFGLGYGSLSSSTERLVTTWDETDDGSQVSVAFSRDRQSIDQLSPKLGVVWSPSERLTLRAALFRTLDRSLVEGRTVAPTQIAGFNQLFDDPFGTRATRGGLGVDYRFSRDLFAGVELTARDLKTPLIFDAQGDADQEEQLHRAYLYWTPTARLALHGEIIFDDYNSERPLITGAPTGVRDLFAPLGVRCFHPNGLFGGLMGSYVNQHVELEGQPDVDSAFWVFDAAVGYRLPRRLGSILLQGKNLFDTEFTWQDSNFRTTEPVDSRWIPERSVFLTLNLVL
jgi:hypothetical protein